MGGVVETAASYLYNADNQLVSWDENDGDPESSLRGAILAYDSRGNRISETLTLAGGVQETTSYTWDYQNRLVAVTDPAQGQHAYAYDYRTRRISRAEPIGATAVSWSGGLSLAEYPVSGLQGAVADALEPTVEYRRGPDMGGGIGGLLHSLRDGAAKYNLGNGRGDVVAQSDQSGALTWTASYEAFGKRPVETGTNADRQRANTKEEDPTGLLWEHFRYRDLETGVWLSRDPAGFVDGPNLYAYVRQNPWSKFDPLGLDDEKTYDRLPVDGDWDDTPGDSRLRNHPKIDSKKAPDGIQFRNGMPDYYDMIDPHDDVLPLDDSARDLSDKQHKKLWKERRGEIPKGKVLHHFDDGKGNFELQLIDKDLHEPLAHTGPMAGKRQKPRGPNRSKMQQALQKGRDMVDDAGDVLRKVRGVGIAVTVGTGIANGQSPNEIAGNVIMDQSGATDAGEVLSNNPITNAGRSSIEKAQAPFLQQLEEMDRQ